MYFKNIVICLASFTIHILKSQLLSCLVCWVAALIQLSKSNKLIALIDGKQLFSYKKQHKMGVFSFLLIHYFLLFSALNSCN